MTSGLGIAIAGVWVPVSAALLSKDVPGQGVVTSTLIALLVTAALVAFG